MNNLELYGTLMQNSGNIAPEIIKSLVNTETGKGECKMNNVMNFKKSQEFVVLASTYFMHLTTEDGAKHKVELTGEEVISTGCPVCGKEHTITFDDFLEIMSDGELFGTSVFCPACSKKRR